MAALSNTSGFSGGYSLRSPNYGLSTFSLATSIPGYLSGSNIVWDTATTAPSITYSTTTGLFLCNFLGVYLIRLYVGVTGLLTTQSVNSSLDLIFGTPQTMGYYSGNCAQAGGILTCPFIMDCSFAPGQAFTCSLTIVGSGPTTTLLGSPSINGSIMYIG
jgi:hypothetical protein